jgi:hypothetical protein
MRFSFTSFETFMVDMLPSFEKCLNVFATAGGREERPPVAHLVTFDGYDIDGFLQLTFFKKVM